MNEKIKPVLNGAAETMLQSFYARAQYSGKKNHKIFDAKAVEIVKRIDYDFSGAEKDKTMSGGVIARTIVLDEIVKKFIAENPDCVVVNIASGLDTRFYRVDNGKIVWYNLDLPETIKIRSQIFEPAERVTNVGISVTNSEWPDEIKIRRKMLFVIEGLSMYLSAEENKKMLKIIRENFDNAFVVMECLAKKWVNHEKLEKSIKQTGAAFKFGADSFIDLGEAAEGFKKIKDDDIIRGMTCIFPFLKPVAKFPLLKKIVQKILIFEKA